MKLKFYFICKISILIAFCTHTLSFAEKSILVDEFGMEATQEWLESSVLNNEDSLFALPELEQNKDFQYSQNNFPVETIINFGKSVWDIIKAGEPVVNLQTDVANALPEGVPNWSSLSNWQTPITNNFSFHWKLLGKHMVRFHYSVIFTPGGKWNDKGAYLTNVALIPTKVKVFWGYTFAAKVDVMRVLNIGTQDNPIAALELRLNISLDSLVAHHESSTIFYMTGDGNFKQMAFY